MQLLCIGDLHLGRDEWQPTIPPTWNAYHCILLVGDIADSHATATDEIYAFYESLGELNPPVITIPGNHDYQTQPQIIADIPGISNGHATQVTGTDATIAGLGSTVFDEGPEIRGPQLTNAPTAASLVDRLAEATESGRSAAGTSTSFSDDALAWYQDRLEALRQLQLEEGDQPRILLTHVPPYGTEGAKLNSQPHHESSVSWGSLALRRYLDTTPIELNLCGHIHDQAGHDIVEGTVTLNAGYRQAFAIAVSTSGVQSIDEVSVESQA